MQILHSDSHVVVIIKPGGMLSVPGKGPDMQDCAMQRVRDLFPGCINYPAAHRLDMDTSGLLAFGLTDEAYKGLSRQFAERSVDKRYIALLQGDVQGREGEIRLPFRLDTDNRPRQIYDPEHGKTGITRWGVLEREDGLTRVEFCPVTGRTHQLRVHAAHPLGLGCPIVGDRLYGTGRQGDALLLHAAYLCFRHPVTGEELAFCSVPDF
ncbi:RluA family pseudouridine synthase [Desulfovibrio psychrotolerans]|uniref:Pseudouridine synthase RsuA/RluA-like domain-containing protein n=1 Tax=Desulfovibrio psychrotolerans TaxID=415242 RepID=A0A7J0BSY4_9BACT|nr:RluA family pseudouridine synthase [Desulfovibrio psychrotolerans]GFM36809.1 hypothetical protein DSM19430T_14930 [Desulfovibrio psychrotolerans]